MERTGRIVRADKKGFNPETTPPILSALRLSGVQWRLLALEIQREATTMFNELDKLAAKESGSRLTQPGPKFHAQTGTVARARVKVLPPLPSLFASKSCELCSS